MALEREQVPANRKWRTEDIFATQEDWEALYGKVEAAVAEKPGFAAYQGKLTDAATVLECMEKLNAINMIDELMIATRHSNTAVHAGDKLCGTRVIPLIIREEKLDAADRVAAGRPILELLPYKLKSAAVITTGSEVASGRIQDTFTPVLEKKLAAFGIRMTEHAVVGDRLDNVAAAIAQMRTKNVDMILCTGGMSVDPDDNTPGAIKKSGARIVSYGAPVLPGAMFLLGYYEDGQPVMGLPGCVMYAKATVFDLLLPRIAAGVRVTREEIAAMGNGGLCLGCESCRYPVCPFGK